MHLYITIINIDPLTVKQFTLLVHYNTMIATAKKHLSSVDMYIYINTDFLFGFSVRHVLAAVQTVTKIQIKRM